MKSSVTRIDVCIATFKRPQWLGELLETLAAQRLPEHLQFIVHVVDNDPFESARLVVDELRERLPYRLTYKAESRPGISYARNSALDCVEGEYVAFVDDDELVAPTWLQHLHAAICRFRADAVFGPVITLLPDDAPSWATSHPTFCRRVLASGTVLRTGATSNVLVRTEALGQPFRRFDEAFALTGGEDTEFFYRLHLSGKKLIWCNEAAVYERVSRDRLTTRWIYRRAYRSGQCFARVFVPHAGVRYRLIWPIKKCSQIVAGIFVLPILYVCSESAYVKLRCRIHAAVGQLTGLLGPSVQYREYQSAAGPDDVSRHTSSREAE